VTACAAERGTESDDLKSLLFVQALRSGIAVRLKAWGTSMAPAICPGDIITAERADPAEIAPGDILVLAPEARLVVHRLVRIVEFSAHSYLILRGDAMPQDDPPAHVSQLLGRVCGIERRPRLAQRGAQVISRMFRNTVQRLAFARNAPGR